MKRLAIVTVVLLVCFAFGACSFTLQARSFALTTVYDGEYAVYGRVVAKETDGTKHFATLDNLYIDGNAEEGKLVAYLPAAFYDTVTLSDEVVLRGDVRTQVRFYGDYGFRAYALDNDQRYYMYVESGVATGHTFDLFLLVRSRMQTVVYAGMDETPAAVTMAVLTGDTTGIDEGLLENVRRGGIAHIFAVSGLHIGALYAFCLFLINKTRLRISPKWLRFGLVAFILIFYGGVCGFSSSVVRATVMCLLFYGARLLGLGRDPLENIGAAAIVVLSLSPASLFTVGFQLSFAACIGIVLLARPITNVCHAACGKIKTLFVKKNEQISDGKPLGVAQRLVLASVSFFSVTFAAQIATAPILLQSFGYLSGWSLLLNCIFVPVVGAAFSVLLLFVLLACLLPTAAAGVVLYIPNVVWSLLLLVFEIVDFSSFSLAGYKVFAPSMIAYYAGIVFCSDKCNLPRRARGLLCAFCVLTFVITMYALNL